MNAQELFNYASGDSPDLLAAYEAYVDIMRSGEDFTATEKQYLSMIVDLLDDLVCNASVEMLEEINRI